MAEELDMDVRRLLSDRRGDWHRIAAGAQVSHSWISKFVNGRIPNPGYGTLKKLKAELAGRPNGSPDLASEVISAT